MRTSDNPARLPPAMRQRAEEAEPHALPDAGSDLDTAVDDAGDGGLDDLRGDRDDDGLHAEPPHVTGFWAPIDEATPRDGRDLIVRWGTDEEGRSVRWRIGRRFTGRRWVEGGRWAPIDGLERGMVPLPAAEPIEWFCVPGYNDQPAATQEPEPEAA